MGKKPIDWEFAAVWFWVAFGKEKPFPVCIHREGGVWAHSAYSQRELTDQQKEAINTWVGQRAVQIEDEWAAHAEPRLNWNKNHLQRQTNEQSE